MSINIQEQLKKFICCLVILSLFLQLFLPLKYAKAGFWDSIKDAMSHISLPDDLELEDDGYVSFGEWFRFCPSFSKQECDCNDPVVCQKECIKCDCRDEDDKNDSGCVAACSGIDYTKPCPPKVEYGKCKTFDGKCYICKHPFGSLPPLGGGWTTPTVDEEQRPLLPKYNIPEECELRIIEQTPDLSKEERLAKARACLYYDLIQRQAAQAVYYAKKIFNATDPFSECLFLRNCRTDCYLRLGEISYTVDLMDIAKAFLPLGWLTVIEKIYNVLEVLDTIKSAYNMGKTYIKSAIALLDNIMGIVNNAKTLYDSVRNLGIGWSNILEIGDGFNNLKTMLKDFGSGLMDFTISKAEAQRTTDLANKTITGIAEDVKKEKEVKAVFQEGIPERQELLKILGDYLLNFESMNEFVVRVFNETFVIDQRKYSQRYTGCSYQQMGPPNVKDQCKACINCDSCERQLPGSEYYDWCFSDIYINDDCERCCASLRATPNFCRLSYIVQPWDRQNGYSNPNQRTICDSLYFDPNGYTSVPKTRSQDFISLQYDNYFKQIIGAIRDSGRATILERYLGEPSAEQGETALPNLVYQEGTASLFCSIPNRIEFYHDNNDFIIDPTNDIYLGSEGGEDGFSYTNRIDWFFTLQKIAGKFFPLRKTLQELTQTLNLCEDPAQFNDIENISDVLKRDILINFNQINYVLDGNNNYQGIKDNISDLITQNGLLHIRNANNAQILENTDMLRLRKEASKDIFWRHTQWQAVLPNEGCALAGEVRHDYSFESDLINYNWNERIKKLINYIPDIEALKAGILACKDSLLSAPNQGLPGAICNCLSPDNPKLSFSIEKSERDIQSSIERLINALNDLKEEAERKAGSSSQEKEDCEDNCDEDEVYCRDICDNRNPIGLDDCYYACGQFPSGKGRPGCREECEDNCDNNSCTRSDCRTACNEGGDGCLDWCDDNYGSNELWRNIVEEIEQILRDFDPDQALEDFRQSAQDIKSAILEIKKIWTADSMTNQEFGVARDFAKDVKETIEWSRKIAEEYLPKMEQAFSDLENAADAIEEFIEGLSDLPDEVQVVVNSYSFSFIIDSFKQAIGSIKMELINPLKEMLGQYEYAGQRDDCTQVQGFLSRIKCFEDRQGKTFEELLQFFIQMLKIDEIRRHLTQSPTSSVRVLIQGLEPKVKMDDLELNTNIVDQAEDNIIAEIKGEKQKPIQYFGDEALNQQGTSWDNFLGKMTENPLSYLEDSFSALQEKISKIRALIDEVAHSIELFFGGEWFDTKRNEPTFKQELSYKDQTQIFRNQINYLSKIIFGTSGLIQGCNLLDPLFKQPYQNIKTTCQGFDFTLLYDPFKTKCEKWLKSFAFTWVDINELKQKCDTLQYQQDFPDVCARVDTLFRYPEFNNEASFNEFKQKCDTLQYQKTLTEECGRFGTLTAALQNKCGSVRAICQEICRTNAFCQDICEAGNCQTAKAAINKIWTKDYCPYPESDNDPIRNYIPCLGLMPDLTNTSNPDLPILTDAAAEICNSQLTDVKSSLNKVMKVFSILMGIRSFTLLTDPQVSLSWSKGLDFQGFGGPKNFKRDAQDFFAQAQNFKSVILGLPDAISDAWNRKPPAGGEGGFDIKPAFCESLPAISVSSETGAAKTGPQGGPVCADVEEFFSLLDSEFSLIRQNLHQIDLERKAISKIKIGPLQINFLKKLPVVFSSLNDVYRMADDVKERVQMLWAFAVAVDFASQNCTCGQSFCDLCLYKKGESCLVPLCLSGLPLTLKPITEPYCYVAYIFRVPMLSMAEKLARLLEATEK